MTVKKTVHVLTRFLASAAMLVLVATPAHAIGLDQAKERGMVCELPNGYLQPTDKATSQVKIMVDTINGKRKQEYERIAKENNVEPRQVGILTAKKLNPKCPG